MGGRRQRRGGRHRPHGLRGGAGDRPAERHGRPRRPHAARAGAAARAAGRVVVRLRAQRPVQDRRRALRPDRSGRRHRRRQVHVDGDAGAAAPHDVGGARRLPLLPRLADAARPGLVRHGPVPRADGPADAARLRGGRAGRPRPRFVRHVEAPGVPGAHAPLDQRRRAAARRAVAARRGGARRRPRAVDDGRLARRVHDGRRAAPRAARPDAEPAVERRRDGQLHARRAARRLRRDVRRAELVDRAVRAPVVPHRRRQGVRDLPRRRAARRLRGAHPRRLPDAVGRAARRLHLDPAARRHLGRAGLPAQRRRRGLPQRAARPRRGLGGRRLRGRLRGALGPAHGVDAQRARPAPVHRRCRRAGARDHLGRGRRALGHDHAARPRQDAHRGHRRVPPPRDLQHDGGRHRRDADRRGERLALHRLLPRRLRVHLHDLCVGGPLARRLPSPPRAGLLRRSQADKGPPHPAEAHGGRHQIRAARARCRAVRAARACHPGVPRAADADDARRGRPADGAAAAAVVRRDRRRRRGADRHQPRRAACRDGRVHRPARRVHAARRRVQGRPRRRGRRGRRQRDVRRHPRRAVRVWLGGGDARRRFPRTGRRLVRVRPSLSEHRRRRGLLGPVADAASVHGPVARAAQLRRLRRAGLQRRRVRRQRSVRADVGRQRRRQRRYSLWSRGLPGGRRVAPARAGRRPAGHEDVGPALQPAWRAQVQRRLPLRRGQHAHARGGRRAGGARAGRAAIRPRDRAARHRHAVHARRGPARRVDAARGRDRAVRGLRAAHGRQHPELPEPARGERRRARQLRLDRPDHRRCGGGRRRGGGRWRRELHGAALQAALVRLRHSLRL